MTIKDIPSDVVAEMLLYIYTGNTPNLNKLAGDLLGAAEQYQLEMLKNICEDKLCSSLEISNSVNHLILGDLYQVPSVRPLAATSTVVLALLSGQQPQEDVLAVCGEEHEHRGEEQGLEGVADPAPGADGGGDGGHGKEGRRGGSLQASWTVSVRGGE